MLYYVAEELAILEQTHQALFDAIHVHDRKITNKEQLAEFFAEHGVSSADFEKAFKAFSVQTKLSRGQKLMRDYRVKGVPSLIVNGKYKTNNFDVVDYLITMDSNSG